MAKKQNAQGGGADAPEEVKPGEGELVSSEPVVETQSEGAGEAGENRSPASDEPAASDPPPSDRAGADSGDGTDLPPPVEVGVGDRVLVYAPAFGHTIHVRGEGLKVEPKWKCEARPGFVMRVHARDGSIELDVRVLADTDTDRVAESIPMVLGVRLLEITPRDPEPVPPSGVVAKPVAILNE